MGDVDDHRRHKHPPLVRLGKVDVTARAFLLDMRLESNEARYDERIVDHYFAVLLAVLREG